SKTLVIFLGVSLPVIYHSYQGARAVEEKMLWSAAAMGMNARGRLLRIVFPAALPEIMVGIRTGLVLALITMVTSEMIARKQGVGDILFNALAIGVTLGVAAAGSKSVEGVVKPLVRVLAPLPKVALYPAMILILGFDDASKIALVAADAVFPILLATYQGTSAVDTKLVWSARAAGCPPRRALFTVVLMAALPSVL